MDDKILLETPGGAEVRARERELALLSELERKVLWLASWTIHNANHIRANEDGLKVGGHQASSASLATIMTALYFAILRPEDRVAVKPHASPIFHAIQYLLGAQSREQLERFRGFGGAQSYPSRTKDKDDVDFSTGSVGLGAAITIMGALARDYLKAKPWAKDLVPGRMVALVGDAELDEGNVYEALLEGWKHGLRDCWWIVDYNRQSLDAVASDRLYDKVEHLFLNMGWEVVTLKYGRRLAEAFKLPGGETLRQWIDACPNSLYSALVFEGGAGWRRQLEADIGSERGIPELLARHDDAGLAQLMTNLGGHDMGVLLDAFRQAGRDRPVCFIAYTIKGYGLPFAGHKDNHAGLMTPAQMEGFRAAMRVREGHEWDPFEGLGLPEGDLEAFLDAVPFRTQGPRRHHPPALAVPADFPCPKAASMSTQEGFGKILNELAAGESELAQRIVTTSPDVTVSTNLGPWVNRRGRFALTPQEDPFQVRRLTSPQKWAGGPDGQHIELGIAENNLFLLLGALGLTHSLMGERLIPIGTLYDPFIQRGLDALNYACYQDARFLLVATPSGITLAPEGGAHQSIATPLIGMAQDGLAAFEPAYVDELAAIMKWAFAYMQRDKEAVRPEAWLREATGGSVYLRLSTRPLAQPGRALDAATTEAIVQGGYWMRPPRDGCRLAICYMGAVAEEAQKAAGLLAEDVPDIAVLAVTSADRLCAGWHAAEKARQLRLAEEAGAAPALAGGHASDGGSYVERLLSPLARDAALVTVLDGHPTALSWLGAVRGHKVQALGVEHFGQTGTIGDLYRHYRIDERAIVEAALAAVGRRDARARGYIS
jgi:pyruvate dehydrogenase E1 component